MEYGVNGEHGVHAPGRVVVAPRQDLEHVSYRAQETTTWKRRHVLRHHAQVFVYFSHILLLLKKKIYLSYKKVA